MKADELTYLQKYKIWQEEGMGDLWALVGESVDLDLALLSEYWTEILAEKWDIRCIVRDILDQHITDELLATRAQRNKDYDDSERADDPRRN